LHTRTSSNQEEAQRNVIGVYPSDVGDHAIGAAEAKKASFQHEVFDHGASL